jgi:transcriptional regulator with XRE-family HTH domain
VRVMVKKVSSKKAPIANRGGGRGGPPNPVDVHVGEQVTARRRLLGVTQEQLAEATGITFQQIQKYEKGRNRISASRLFQFARVLDAPVSFFFEGFAAPDKKIGIQPGFADNDQEPFTVEDAEESFEDVMKQKETLTLVRTYYTIDDPDVRKDFLKLLKQMAKNYAA